MDTLGRHHAAPETPSIGDAHAQPFLGMSRRRLPTMAVPSCRIGRPAADGPTPRPPARLRRPARAPEGIDPDAAGRRACRGPARKVTRAMFAKLEPRLDGDDLDPVGPFDRRRPAGHGRVREHTVMFTDIEGFTRLAETLPPTLVARLLRSHFRLLAACIEGEQGRIDKVMGDGLIAVWAKAGLGVPACAPALRAALAIRGAMAVDNERRRRRGEPAIRLRIGVHVGPLFATPLGAAGRLGILLCGDTINVAQRLEEAARGVGADDGRDVTIVASDAVLARAGWGFRFAELGRLPVRGRREPVAAFEVAMLPDDRG